MRSTKFVATTLALTVAVLTSAGCATVQPHKISAPVASGADAAYKCALGQVTSLGYTLEQASKESGFFKAEKNFVPGPGSINWGVPITFEITVLVAEDAAGTTTLQLTGATGKGASKNMRLVQTSPEVKDHMQQIVSACGTR